MEVEKLTVGQMAENCYLVYDKINRETVIIDPGDDGDYLIRKIIDLKLKPVYIVATHGHFDHILAVLELKLAYKIPFLIHQADLFLLELAQQSAKHFLGIEVDPIPKPDKFFKDGDEIKFRTQKLRVMETPGHTSGSICLLGKNVVFTGDTVFAEGVGRTDFAYSSRDDLQKSLKKILKLPDKTLVYPGHGEETTIKALISFPASISSG